TTIGTDIAYAAELLKRSEVVGVPTETVYGLAANALSPDAVVKIFEAKNRPFFDPLIVHCKSMDGIGKYVSSIPKWAETLADAFSPGPITFLLPKRESIPDIVTSGLERVGIRIPSHPMLQELLSQIDFPLAAPSANPFGYISPTTAQHVYDQLEGKIHYILNGGQATVGVESTIVGEEDGKIIVYRLGGVSVEQIEELVGKVELRVSSSMPSAPGSLDSHYAPKIQLRIKDSQTQPLDKNVALICFSKFSSEIPQSNQRILSTSGDLTEAAKNLFAYMRELDAGQYDGIYVELVPDSGLGRAINDRIFRASIKQ
ncbi:MAG TPA: L-threonylcarbamoyladenylate synthase, partial [Candidatus Kapabacteria bacterium]